MVNTNTLINLLNRRVNKVLTVAETALSPQQFNAFRKFTLDEFGDTGLIREIRNLENRR